MKFIDIVQNPLLAPEYYRRWIVLALGFAVAIVVAYWIANQQILMIGILAGVMLTVMVAVGMQLNAWLLILLFWELSGSTYVLPLPVSVHDIAIILATCAYITYRILIGTSTRRPWGVLESLVALNCAMIVFTYVCHPVGLRALGSGTMGGRPYFNIFVAACAYWVVVHMPESYKNVARAPLWVLAGASIVALLNLIVYVIPAATKFIVPFYAGIDYSSLFTTTATNMPEVQRFTQLGAFGLIMAQVMVAYFPPLTLFNPLRIRCYLYLVAIAALLAAGFRNVLVYAMVSFAIASLIHNGWRQLAMAGTVGALIIVSLAFCQGRLFELPLTAQRALSFVPGKWSEAVNEEIESSDSRWEMWRMMLKEGTIRNWWVGDGFGVTAQDFEKMRGGRMSFAESAQITGTYHNGPMTSIRFSGVIGMILFYAWMIATAVYSVKCVRLCRGTPLFPVATFLAVQLVWAPVHYTFIFGAYPEYFPEMLLLSGLLILIQYTAEKHFPPPIAPAARLTRTQRLATEPAVPLRPGSLGN